MEHFQKILFEVWREACKHIDIKTSLFHIGEKLRGHLPVQQLTVFYIDHQSKIVQHLADGMQPSRSSTTSNRIEMRESEWKVLNDWLQTNRVTRKAEGPISVLNRFCVMDQAMNYMVGPLKYQDVYGVIVLVAPPHHEFEERHVQMAQLLLEPLSIALETNKRFHELEILREAAEIDKTALLNRLGRKDIGDTIIGADTTLRFVMERIDMVAQSDVPVLVLGETGTGKELIAREIHRRSHRSKGPIMRVNCGAIPSELIDSQLFGHEKGSFTGAVDQHRGWFERADGGTLFLDEIGELPLPVQVRLLRILQDGWLERVGGQKPIKVDVRVVAATHRDLSTMVYEGTFREDLWYRLAVFPILLPPLRERLEDIGIMAKYFAERSAIRFNLPVCYPTKEDIEILKTYHWPGNIRELASVIDRAALLGNGNRLEVGQALGGIAPRQPAPRMVPSRPSSQSPFLPLDEVVKDHIQEALRITRGRVEGEKGAARLLGINPNTLRARMKKLGIAWRDFKKIA